MTFMELKTAPYLLIFVIVYFGVMILGSLCMRKILLTIRQIVKGMYCRQCGSLENVADKVDNISCESVQLDVRE